MATRATATRHRQKREAERRDSQAAAQGGLFSEGQLALPGPCGATDRLLILFGTATGTAERIAHRVADAFRQRGFVARVEDMCRYKAELLARERYVFIVISTYGNGEPPDDALEFWHDLMSGCWDLHGLRFSVLALGNSTYEKFCQCGKDFDAALERLGGTRLFPRVDCDMDFTEPVDFWLRGLLGALAQEGAAFAAA
ncbi:MAG TPA: flavodoxin domain-containing protein [Candidatus Acidoferrales bacterium]|nr:flavodoxin domain-containing protein [Candidatus Acidoferrales bacterium]